MSRIDYPILSLSSVPRNRFVQFWSARYDYKGTEYEAFISQSVNERRATIDERLIGLFSWKNGRALSGRKLQTVLGFLSPGERVAPDIDADVLEKYLCRAGGVIWRVFWLHLQHPERSPSTISTSTVRWHSWAVGPGEKSLRVRQPGHELTSRSIVPSSPRSEGVIPERSMKHSGASEDSSAPPWGSRCASVTRVRDVRRLSPRRRRTNSIAGSPTTRQILTT